MVERLKRSNSPKWFFSQNTTNKIFVYLLAPFILQNFEKILRVNPELCHFRAQNGPFVISKFFWYKPLLLSSTYWPFSLCKILKILTADPELWGWAIFGPKMVHLPQTIFFWKIINITLIHLLAPFIVQNFKKIRELWGCAIFGPKIAHFSKW